MPHQSAKHRFLPRSSILALTLMLSSLFTSAHAATELMVSAASSLTQAFREIGPTFEQRQPNIKVRFNFAASDTLVQQIAKGAPVDVLATADAEAMDKAARQNLIDAASRKNFAGNRLALVVPARSTLTVDNLGDLRQPAMRRITLGNPTAVPAGRYARQTLELAGFWKEIEPRTILAQSVRQSLDYTAREEVDAGFVYSTDAALLRDKVRIALLVPTATPIVYPIAAVTGRNNGEAARQFVSFVLSPEAQAILARHGFTKP